jgi:hypothetical protein
MKHLLFFLVMFFGVFQLQVQAQDIYVCDQITLSDEQGELVVVHNVCVMVTDTAMYMRTEFDEPIGTQFESFYYYTTISGAHVYSNEYADMSIERLSPRIIYVNEHIIDGASRHLEMKELKYKDKRPFIRMMEDHIKEQQ